MIHKVVLNLLAGTRIIYERKFLLDLKNSPLSKTPTKLPVIPGVTLDDNGIIIEEEEEANENEKNNINKQVKAVPMEEQNGNDPKKSHGKSIFVSSKALPTVQGIVIFLLPMNKNQTKMITNKDDGY